MKRLLTVAEVAEKVGLSVPSIYRYTSQRKIPHIKLNRRVVFDEEAIDGWLKDHSVMAGSFK